MRLFKKEIGVLLFSFIAGPIEYLEFAPDPIPNLGFWSTSRIDRPSPQNFVKKSQPSPSSSSLTQRQAPNKAEFLVAINRLDLANLLQQSEPIDRVWLAIQQKALIFCDGGPVRSFRLACFYPQPTAPLIYRSPEITPSESEVEFDTEQEEENELLNSDPKLWLDFSMNDLLIHLNRLERNKKSSLKRSAHLTEQDVPAILFEQIICEKR